LAKFVGGNVFVERPPPILLEANKHGTFIFLPIFRQMTQIAGIIMSKHANKD
jgi:hypothetical protein